MILITVLQDVKRILLNMLNLPDEYNFFLLTFIVPLHYICCNYKSFNFLLVIIRWIGLFIFQVFFLPLSNTIITGFKDDTIFAWESDTLNCKYQLPVPPGKSPHYKAYAPTRWSTFSIPFSCMLLWNIATTLYILQMDHLFLILRCSIILL